MALHTTFEHSSFGEIGSDHALASTTPHNTFAEEWRIVSYCVERTQRTRHDSKVGDSIGRNCMRAHIAVRLQPFRGGSWRNRQPPTRRRMFNIHSLRQRVVFCAATRDLRPTSIPELCCRARARATQKHDDSPYCVTGAVPECKHLGRTHPKPTREKRQTHTITIY